MVPEVAAELEVGAGRSAVALVGLQVVVEAVAAADDRHQVLFVAVARIVDEVLAMAAREDALLVVVVVALRAVEEEVLVVIESEARVEVEDWDSKQVRRPGIEEGVVLAVHDLVVGVVVEDVLVVEAFEELE